MPRGQKPPSCRWVGTRAACTGAAALTPSGSGQARAAWGQHGAGAPPPALAPLSFPLGRGSTRTRGCGCVCNIQSPGGGFTSSVVWRSPLAVVMRLLGCEWLGRLFDLNAGILLNLGLIAGILLNLGQKFVGPSALGLYQDLRDPLILVFHVANAGSRPASGAAGSSASRVLAAKNSEPGVPLDSSLASKAAAMRQRLGLRTRRFALTHSLRQFCFNE